MQKLTVEQMDSIGKEIDRLFLAKARNKPEPEMKAVWILDFEGIDFRAIIAGFQYCRKTAGVWPEVAQVLDGAKKWKELPEIKEMLCRESHERSMLQYAPKQKKEIA